MSLHEYIKSLEKLELEALAVRCNTSVGQIKHVAYGNRRAAAGLAVCLERETQGVVTCEELRPDIDWGFIRRSLPAREAA
ncbi:transcriptional regulator [Azotobacter chroococcum]|uniref:transcriptional regulator n=1 Tax=Azotobacter chroococcum TaxID=353 RepID=UPI0010AE2DCC|nr:YdaS family helix-turn-helix protein [Azotobacter chroococcum]TKD40724.1 helix-turn-helix domain-containing protein [Azotobacter chroococcum]